MMVAWRRVAWRGGVAALSIVLGWPAVMPTAHAQEPPAQELPPVVVTAPPPRQARPARTTARPKQVATGAATQTAPAPASDPSASTAAASELSLSRERVNAQPAL